LFALGLLAVPYAGSQHLGDIESPRVAWSAPNPNYPLKVHVLSSDRRQSRYAGIVSTKSYGSGNLLGSPVVGFDYNSDCDGGFMRNAERGDSYQGKWKKQDRKIEILIVPTGSNHFEKCEINVTLKAAPYSRNNPPPRLVTAH
jgi:hypothetical protein